MKNQPQRFLQSFALAMTLVLLTPALSAERLQEPQGAGNTETSIVIRWNEALLQAVRDSRIGPPMVARALAIAHTCMYDAWAAYDRKALGTQLTAQLRRPVHEATPANIAAAISYAANTCGKSVFPAAQSPLF